MPKHNSRTSLGSAVPKFVGVAEVASQLGIHPRTLSRMVRDGRFPKPLQLSPNRVGWPVGVVLDWIEQRGASLEAAAVADPDELEPAERLAKAFDDMADVIEEETGLTTGAGMAFHIVDEDAFTAPMPMEFARQLNSARLQQMQHEFHRLNRDQAIVMAAQGIPGVREFVLSLPLGEATRAVFASDELLLEEALAAMQALLIPTGNENTIGDFAISGDSRDVVVKRKLSKTKRH